MVSRSHRPPLVDTIISEMGLKKERSIGSVGLKIGLIARGQAEFYVHPNPRHQGVGHLRPRHHLPEAAWHDDRLLEPAAALQP